MQALSGFANVLKVKDLRDRVLFTLFILLIYRLGGFIPVPGVNAQALSEFFNNSSNNVFSLYNTFVGGALSRAAIFSLGIMPYITASIIIQLMGTVSPKVAELQKQGMEGRAKLTQWTRYFTIFISGLQSIGISSWIFSQHSPTGQALVVDGIGRFAFVALSTLTLTTGTVFIMWLGEQITARGIGNGISLIIFIGIIARVPVAIFNEFEMFYNQEHSLAMELIIIGVVVAIIMFIIYIDQGTRRIPLQSPRRVVGRKIMGGQSSFLPLKVNTAGVMPVIFASAIMFLPAQLVAFFPHWQTGQAIGRSMLPGELGYSITYVVLIVFFTYFYTAIQYNPNDIAENLKKSGGFIPGIRPGKKTAEFIDSILTRVTLTCAIFLAVISVGPFYLKDALGMSFYIGGTSVLICIGVALETLRQFQARLQEQNYDGFMKKGKIKGRKRY
ncbi:MAG: preprotein translocase subunit SecY [Fibrobacteria bacterium]|nr:preprotein translocase subunit SecY [Fibrobacteria bacterium]